MKKFACFSLLLATATLSAAQDGIVAERITDAVLVITGGGGNVTAVATDAGVVMVDTFISPGAARRALELIDKEFGGKPVRYVINTHYHLDHTFGNQVFAGATIIAHSNCAQRVKADNAVYAERYAGAGARVIELEKKFRTAVEKDAGKAKEIKEQLDMARQTAADYSGFVLTPAALRLESGATLLIGNKTFKLLHFGKGHTDGDLVVLVPEEKLLVTGDLVFHHSVPYIDVGAGADITGWISRLEEMIALGEEFEHVVPGHGEVGSVQALIDQRYYLQDLWNAVGNALHQGLTLDEAKESIELEKYKDYGRYERSFPSNVEACWQIYEREAGQEGY